MRRIGESSTRYYEGMKFRVFVDGGIGLREVEAEEIDGAYAAAVEQFGCPMDDILAVMPCVTMREYLEQVGRGKRGAAHDI